MAAVPDNVIEEVPTTVKVERGTEGAELIGEQLEAFCDAADRLSETGLTRRAIVVLIHDRLNGVGKREINLVLDILPELRKYLKR